MAVRGIWNGTPFGCSLNFSSSGSTTTLNSAGTWIACGFTVPEALTLNNARMCFGVKTGTIVAADVTASLYSTTATSGSTIFKPNALLDGPRNCDSAPTAVGFYSFSGFTYALSANTLYWIVIKNVHATPASNYPRVMYNTIKGHNYNYAAGNSTIYDQLTTDSGTTWTNSGRHQSLRVGFSNGDYYGCLFGSASFSTTAGGYGVYSTREEGMKFTTPANVALNVRGVGIAAGGFSGTPTGEPRIRLYTGSTPTLIATANCFRKPSGQYYPQVEWFDDVYTIDPETVVRITLGETTQSDTSSNYYRTNLIPLDTDSNSVGLLPYGACATYYNGTSWSDSSSNLIPAWLILDDQGEFTASGGGGGSVRFPRTLTGF